MITMKEIKTYIDCPFLLIVTLSGVVLFGTALLILMATLNRPATACEPVKAEYSTTVF